jgi:TonB-dependent receptor-like protein
MRPARYLLATTVLAAFCAAAPAAAQSDLGEIDVQVIDTGTSGPLGNARTFLLGAQTANAQTTGSGTIKFTDVPVGIYRVRVQSRGYDAATTREFDVLPDRAVHVRVALSKRTGSGAQGSQSASSSSSVGSNLKTIAVVTARSRVSITTTTIDADSPLRRLSDSLTDALDKLAGVSVTTDSTDPTSAVQVSLHNQDESQTALTLDGIPLSGPGAAGNLRSIGSDLFSGSSVSFSPSAGGLAGGVGFSTLQPTQALQVRASGTTGTFDRSNYMLATTGSIDKLGFVLEHTWRGSNSPLTFQDYEDQSGLTYPHGGESTSLSDLMKVRYSLNDERTSITATALDTNRNAYAICAQDVTVLPCGIGPNNRTYGRYGMAYTQVQSLVGNVETSVTAYANSSTTTTDDLDRFVVQPVSSSSNPSNPSSFAPVLDPQFTLADTLTRGLAYSASIAQGNHTLSFVGSTYAATVSSDPIVGSQFTIPFSNSAASTRYSFNDAIKSSDKLTLTPSLSFADTTGIGGSVLGGISATWTPKTRDAFAFSVNAGSSQPNLNATRSFSDPLSARFNCDAGTALVSGPGDTGNGQGQSAFSTSAAWTHQLANGSSLSLDAYSQVQSGQLINAMIDEPASYYTAAGTGYLDQLLAAYRAPTVCGQTAAPPAVYAMESIGGTRRIYQGVDLSGRFQLSPYLTAIPTYSLNLATLTAAGPRLQDGPSTTIVGAQLPNRPIHRAGITLDGLLPRSGLELLANAQYTGANNQQNLGPYVLVSMGASHKFGPGEVTLFENNVFNTYGAEFATDAFAQPLPLSNGLPFVTAASPLLPRTIFLSYAMAIGGPAPGPAFGRAGRGARVAAAPSPTPEPSASPGARRAQRFTSNPPPPGVDPLSLATSRDSCDATAQADAKPLYDALHAYVAAYGSGATTLPPVPNTTIVAHKATADPTVPYYLEVRPNFPRPPGASAANGARPPRGAFGPPGGGGFGPGGGGPGEPGGPPPGGDVTAQSQAGPTPEQQAARRAFLNSPAIKAYRGFVGCAYISILSADAAKAKGVVPEGGRPGLFYVPSIGLVFVEPFALPQGGGSLRNVPSAAPAPSPAAPAQALPPSPPLAPSSAPSPASSPVPAPT